MLAGLFAKFVAMPLIGPILKMVMDGALSGYKMHLDAVGSHEAAVAEIAQKSIALDQREAELNAAVVIAEQGNWITRSVRPLMAMPVIFIIWKLLVWDKALGQWTHGHTDPLDPKLWGLMMAIVVSYMGGRSAEKIADKISGIFNKSKTGA